MKKLIILACFALSCAGAKSLTMEEFYDVSLGMTEDQLKAKYGKPDKIYSLSSGDVEFEYIERINIENRPVERRHYFFIIRDKRVSSKRIQSEEHPPLYHRNAYDLQTSQNDE